jgi:hypothetical protein
VRDFLIASGVIALSLGIVGGVVLGLDDEGTFVSPAEVVGEEFVRALGHSRIGLARGMLASDVELATSSAELRALSERFRSRVGRVNCVEGTAAGRRLDTVIVRTHVEGQPNNLELTFPLVREHGNWVIAHVNPWQSELNHLPAGGARQP